MIRTKLENELIKLTNKSIDINNKLNKIEKENEIKKKNKIQLLGNRMHQHRLHLFQMENNAR